MAKTTDFDYKRHLASREWAVLREAVRLRAALGVPAWMPTAYCERCGIHPLRATHHLTYERIGHEELDDLLGVCNGCHAYLSGKSDTDPVDEALSEQIKELAWAAKELAEVVDWTDYHPRGCLSVAQGSIDIIARLMSYRAVIADGRLPQPISDTARELGL